MDTAAPSSKATLGFTPQAANWLGRGFLQLSAYIVLSDRSSRDGRHLLLDDMKTLLQLKIIVENPPVDVAFAVQRGRSDLLGPSSASLHSLVFEFPVLVADTSAQPPRLTGEFTQGPPAARFIYVNSGTYAGQAGSCWSRRAKVPLAGITATLLQSAIHSPHGVLVASISGTGRDGGPACASVPLLSGWTLVAAA